MRHLRATSVLALLLAAGCPPSQQQDPNAPPKLDKVYPDGPDGLKALWTDILVAAQRDERQKVHDLMASQMMTDADLDALFGPAKAKELKPRYAPMIARLINAGAMELVAQITDRKYDEIEVYPVEATGSAADRATLAALPPGTRVYGVRVRRKGQKLGLRYDFFVYRDAHWVTGNQLAKYLVPETADGGTPATTTAVAAPHVVDAGVRDARR